MLVSFKISSPVRISRRMKCRVVEKPLLYNIEFIWPSSNSLHRWVRKLDIDCQDVVLTLWSRIVIRVTIPSLVSYRQSISSFDID